MALVNEFDEAMLDIYRTALNEAGYNAVRFLGMLNDRGGLGTAKYLINSPRYPNATRPFGNENASI